MDFDPRDVDPRDDERFSARDRWAQGGAEPHYRDDDWRQFESRTRDGGDDARTVGRGPGNDARGSQT